MHLKASSARGLPRKRVGERACDLVAVKSPSVSFADSSLAEGAFIIYSCTFAQKRVQYRKSAKGALAWHRRVNRYARRAA